MIALQKTDIPQILADNAAQWTSELLGYIERGEKLPAHVKSRYNHPIIKAALLIETHQKCAYCESKFTHVTYGDIEHVSPKALEPKQTFDWNNLTIACDICNTRKGNIAYGIVVDPYVDDPAEHFLFAGAIVFAIPPSAKGASTQVLLELNRGDLLERRKERLENIHRHLTVIAGTTDAQTREAMEAIFKESELSDSSEYCAMVRAFMDQF